MRLFDDYVHLAMGRPPSTCATSGSCERDRTTDADGKRQNYYCAAFRRFFGYAAPRLCSVAAAEYRALHGGR